MKGKLWKIDLGTDVIQFSSLRRKLVAIKDESGFLSFTDLAWKLPKYGSKLYLFSGFIIIVMMIIIISFPMALVQEIVAW